MMPYCGQFSPARGLSARVAIFFTISPTLYTRHAEDLSQRDDVQRALATLLGGSPAAKAPADKSALDSITADLKALISEKGCGPIMIRLSWHDVSSAALRCAAWILIGTQSGSKAKGRKEKMPSFPLVNMG